jgi:enoyl-CoA hydratase/carnithine racemase
LPGATRLSDGRSLRELFTDAAQMSAALDAAIEDCRQKEQMHARIEACSGDNFGARGDVDGAALICPGRSPVGLAGSSVDVADIIFETTKSTAVFRELTRCLD